MSKLILASAVLVVMTGCCTTRACRCMTDDWKTIIYERSCAKGLLPCRLMEWSEDPDIEAKLFAKARNRHIRAVDKLLVMPRRITVYETRRSFVFEIELVVDPVFLAEKLAESCSPNPNLIYQITFLTFHGVFQMSTGYHIFADPRRRFAVLVKGTRVKVRIKLDNEGKISRLDDGPVIGVAKSDFRIVGTAALAVEGNTIRITAAKSLLGKYVPDFVKNPCDTPVNVVVRTAASLPFPDINWGIPFYCNFLPMAGFCHLQHNLRLGCIGVNNGFNLDWFVRFPSGSEGTITEEAFVAQDADEAQGER